MDPILWTKIAPNYLHPAGGLALLVATGTAHLEFGSREQNAAVPLCPDP